MKLQKLWKYKLLDALLGVHQEGHFSALLSCLCNARRGANPRPWQLHYANPTDHRPLHPHTNTDLPTLTPPHPPLNGRKVFAGVSHKNSSAGRGRMSATDDEDNDALAPPQYSPGSNVSSVDAPHRRGVAGAGAGGYTYAVNFGRADFLGPRSESRNSADDAEPTEQELFGGGDEPPDYNMAQECHVSKYEDFEEIFLAGLSARPPAFYQLPGHGWCSYKELYTPDQEGELTSFLPVRTMVFNLPIELWSSDAARFVDWATPKVGASRAANLAALIGLIYTPLSKGWL